ncbi:MAG: transcription elongation factor Spt5 [Nanoarchaeota archaeon]|nr:transcription elongation factor Spt5 [Nanoarchaeota archaeon]
MIYTIRITVGRESTVINTLANRAQNLGLPVKSIFYPFELKGYIFLESDDNSVLERLTSGVPHVRGLVAKPVPFEQMKRFLEAKRIEIKINRGDIVEIVSGPFKGEKGKITRVDETKDEVTVEFLEAAVPIPITVAIDSVKLTQKGEEQK